jgi:proteic killer suppression protein
MIKSYRCEETQRLAEGYRIRRFAELERDAQRKLAQLDAASTVAFLQVPIGNRFDALPGDGPGWFTVRINDHWRIRFRYQDGHAHDVEIVEYH